jgi:tripartite-type tricarboxylate transporter receptor subunit TctC
MARDLVAWDYWSGLNAEIRQKTESCIRRISVDGLGSCADNSDDCACRMAPIHQEIPTMKKHLVAAMMLAAAFAVNAFPNKPIKIVVPFSAGTVTDLLARELGQSLAGVVKQAVVVENRTGAEGSIGAQSVLNAEADGHTLMFSSFSISVIDPFVKKTMPYDPLKDFAPVCSVAKIDNILNMSATLPYKNIADFLADARRQPGKFTFGYSSAATRLAGELFAQSAGIKLTGVPYRATVAGLTDVASGQVDLFFIDQTSAKAFYDTGRIKPMVIAGTQRLKSLPQVPSASEVGVPGYAIQPWFAVYASAKTSAGTFNEIGNALKLALKTPAFTALLEKTGLQEFSLCGDDIGRFMLQDVKSMAQVVKEAGIEKQ